MLGPLHSPIAPWQETAAVPAGKVLRVHSMGQVAEMQVMEARALERLEIDFFAKP